jgi:hypothetical protein
MKISNLLIGLLCLTIFTGCVEGSNKMNYKINNISDITYKIEGAILELSYSPLVESLYYSPGVTYNIIDDKMVIKIIRCGINDDCKVDVKAMQGQTNLVKIEIGELLDPNNIYINEIKDTNNLNTVSK